MKGLGIDIVQIKRIENLYHLYGNKFLEKIFSPAEIDESTKKGHFIQSIAGKFAAKEAFIKATSGLLEIQLSFLDILILCDLSNKPYISIKNKKDIKPNYKFLVSISHEKEYAVSVVLVS